MGVSHWSELVNLTGPAQMLNDVRRLWKVTGGNDSFPAEDEAAELRAYYQSTVQKMLFELDELEKLFANAGPELLTKFAESRQLLSRQLQLLMGIGMLMMYPEKPSNLSQDL